VIRAVIGLAGISSGFARAAFRVGGRHIGPGRHGDEEREDCGEKKDGASHEARKTKLEARSKRFCQ
jgi:hypothetical protein